MTDTNPHTETRHTEVEALVDRIKDRTVAYEAAKRYGIALTLDHVDISRMERMAELLAALLAELDARTNPDLAARRAGMAARGGDQFDLRLNMTHAERDDVRAAARLLGGNPPIQTPAPILRHGVFVRENSGLWESYIDGNYIADHASESEAWAALGVDPPPTARLLGGDQ